MDLSVHGRSDIYRTSANFSDNLQTLAIVSLHKVKDEAV